MGQCGLWFWRGLRFGFDEVAEQGAVVGDDALYRFGQRRGLHQPGPDPP
jgi:hypothetical protein